jgi:hypothetical protein
LVRDAFSIGWIAPLAEPYLRSYRPVAERGDSLCGYWFLCPEPGGAQKATSGLAPPHGSKSVRGFFVGYLTRERGYAFLQPQPPECLVFAFVHPVGGGLHRRLVTAEESLLRHTFEYIRWLTHRPPRFSFHPDELPAVVRHLSLREWPREKYEHYARNFFIETLAWLVRSALVRKLLREPASAAVRRPGGGVGKFH